MQQPKTARSRQALALAKRSLRTRLPELRWTLTGLGLALLVLLVLPSSQIRLGASQLHGMVGSYTSGGHFWQASYSSTGTTSWHYLSGYTVLSNSQAWSPTGSGDYVQNGSYLDAQTNGTVTATLNWVPTTGQNNTTDPPATNVIVTESGSASWAGGGNGSNGAGAANDGWSDPVSNGSASGTRYLLKDGSSGTITLPAFTVSANTPGYTSISQLGARVIANFNVAGAGITINSGNTIFDAAGHPNILVGQGCTASLTGIPANSTNPSYQWSVEGNKFQSWTASTSSAVLAGGLGATTNATAHWYWSDIDGFYNVTCNAMFTPPAVQGSPPPVPISLNLVQKIHLRVPTTTETATVGRVEINNHAPPDYGVGYALYAGGNAHQAYGIIFTTQVNTPAPFSAGIWNLVQLVTPSTLTTPATQNQGNGILGLDSHYPFYPYHNPSYPIGVPANNLLAQAYDGPGIPNIKDAITEYNVLDTYNTYVMFLPPGGDTQWVPIWDVDWYWNATDYIPGASWMNWNDANDAGIIRVTNSASNTLHPQWSYLH